MPRNGWMVYRQTIHGSKQYCAYFPEWQDALDFIESKAPDYWWFISAARTVRGKAAIHV